MPIFYGPPSRPALAPPLGARYLYMSTCSSCRQSMGHRRQLQSIKETQLHFPEYVIAYYEYMGESGKVITVGHGYWAGSGSLLSMFELLRSMFNKNHFVNPDHTFPHRSTYVTFGIVSCFSRCIQWSNNAYAMCDYAFNPLL
jgi:hypothetical protein